MQDCGRAQTVWSGAQSGTCSLSCNSWDVQRASDAHPHAWALEVFSHCAGTMDRRSAEHALQLAREAAHRAVTRAAYLAGAAGLDYTAPAGFPVDLTNVPKVGWLHLADLEAMARMLNVALFASYSIEINVSSSAMLKVNSSV